MNTMVGLKNTLLLLLLLIFDVNSERNRGDAERDLALLAESSAWRDLAMSLPSKGKKGKGKTSKSEVKSKKSDEKGGE